MGVRKRGGEEERIGSDDFQGSRFKVQGSRFKRLARLNSLSAEPNSECGLVRLFHPQGPGWRNALVDGVWEQRNVPT